MNDNPILNSPYDEPRSHYATDDDRERSINYSVVLEGRRMFDPAGQPTPTRRGRQRNVQVDEPENDEAESHIINLLRAEVGRWRADSYPNTTRVTRDLLHFWFLDPERIAQQKLFFAQQESVETAIWLNEVAANSN